MSSLRSQIESRALTLLFIVGIAFLVLLLNFSYVMVVNPVSPGIGQREAVTKDRPEPPRGKITDRRGNVLAISIQKQSLFANPRAIRNPRKVSRTLSEFINKDAPQVYERITKERYFVWLARKLDHSTVRKIQELNLAGVGFEPEYERAYPQTIRSGFSGSGKIGLAAPVLGYVGIDNQGLDGIELQYNELLSDVDQFGVKPGPNQQSRVSSPGVQLTIDQTIQFIAEDELIKMAREERPKNAMVVVMNPQNGDILAMANWPSFDPNNFTDFSRFQRRNRALAHPFEPGSTLKVMTVSTGLADGDYKPETEFFCQSYIYLSRADHTLHCYARHGSVNIPEILIQSCNVGTVKAVQEVDDGRFFQYMREFGFGNLSGLGLPGEARGVLRRPSQWSALTKPSMAIGQGISTTALQLTNALSGIVNDGVLMRPRLVRSTVRDGRKKHNEPMRIRRVLPEDVSDKIKAYMESVISDGTGRRAYSQDYRLGGKTGTAQKANLEEGGYYEDRVLTSFIGYGPVGSPKLAISVIVDEPQKGRYGGEVAAPVFRRIIERSLDYLERNPL